MSNNSIPESLRRHEIAGHLNIVVGNGGLPLLKIKTPWSNAEIYLHGAHVCHFQKNGEPPMIFISAKSFFAPEKAIRGGVPICYPWFGAREGQPMHGFARLTEWQLIRTMAAPDGAVTVTLALPVTPEREAWKNLRTEFIVTVGQTLSMELVSTNESCEAAFEIENCLHTYFYVGDISAVTITGLEDAAFLDFAHGANGASRLPESHAIQIGCETNRAYYNTPDTVKIHDAKLKRVIRVEKSCSRSTVVWNPWTTQKMPEDWGTNEHLSMVCVESGNVKAEKLSLGPGKFSALKVILSSSPLK